MHTIKNRQHLITYSVHLEKILIIFYHFNCYNRRSGSEKMKFLKYFFVFVLLFFIGIAGWLYYPQYQINKMKSKTVAVNGDTSKISFINFFRQEKSPQLFHLAIGDSVIHGVGAQQHKDLVYQFSNKLASQIHKKIKYKNEGINGITSGELNKLVQSGRFDKEIKKADIVTINVGGNDILQIVKESNFYSALHKFDQLQSNFSKNLSSITARIHHLNPKATIVFLELYNPLPPSNQYYSIADKLLPKWNLNIYEVANQYTSSIVVETSKVINGEKLKNLSPDGVHPNSAGYTAISEQMIYQLKHQYRKQSA
jgi:lysophospholipase L1-like esterase